MIKTLNTQIFFVFAGLVIGFVLVRYCLPMLKNTEPAPIAINLTTSTAEKITAANAKSTMDENEARKIAEKTCVKGGEALGPGSYNENSKTWWFDANLNTAQQGCNPACVVNAGNKTAEINWRCTGAIPPSVTGQPIACTMDAKICPDGNAVGRTAPDCEFAPCPQENTNEIKCTTESRKAELCAQVYDPVCATVNIQCIKEPCEPVKQTFSNVCEACKNKLVEVYSKGECQNNTKK